MTPQPSSITRRHFLRSGSALLAAPAIITAANTLRAQQKADSNETLRIGLIGCGGRGTGAAANALAADYNGRVVAMADVFEKQIETSILALSASHADRVTVTPDRRFVGLDAYRKLLQSGVDVVILATPPGYRPQHLAEAIEAGKHIFSEKPMAVDAIGYHLVQAALAKAKEKKLKVVAGFCWRYNTSRREAFQRLHDGEIGELNGYFGTQLTSPVKPMAGAEARPADMSDVEWQLRNWYNFSWLSGDSLVEQAVHSVDKMMWAFKDAAPLNCIASGGRQVPSPGGNIFDHFNVAYEFAGGVIGQIASRQILGCDNENADFIRGSKGRIVLGKGPAPFMEGEKRWRFRERESNMYQIEHDEFFAAIRADKPIFDGDWMMQSTLAAIMGREAAYTGKRITWEQILASKQDLAPEEKLQWGDKFEPTPRPVPGVTKFV
jgi:predicted dehydrogenase